MTIDRKEYEFADPHQTGKSLKERAGIPLGDVLFLDRPHDDEVITDDTKIVLKMGEHLSQLASRELWRAFARRR